MAGIAALVSVEQIPVRLWLSGAGLACRREDDALFRQGCAPVPPHRRNAIDRIISPCLSSITEADDFAARTALDPSIRYTLIGVSHSIFK